MPPLLLPEWARTPPQLHQWARTLAQLNAWARTPPQLHSLVCASLSRAIAGYPSFEFRSVVCHPSNDSSGLGV